MSYNSFNTLFMDSLNTLCADHILTALFDGDEKMLTKDGKFRKDFSNFFHTSASSIPLVKKHVEKMEKGFNIQILPKSFREHPAIARKAILCDVNNFFHLSDSLRKDPLIRKRAAFGEILLKKNSNKNESFLIDRLEGEFVERVKAHQGIDIDFFTNGLACLCSLEDENDKEILLDAVNKRGCALRNASDDMKNDEDVVLAAVNQNGNALEWASDEMKNNQKIVLAAVNQNGCALEYASDDMKNDKDVVLAAETCNTDDLSCALEEVSIEGA